MKTRRRRRSFLIIAFAATFMACTPATSFAIFGFGSAKADMLKKADASFSEATAARDEGRVLDELSALSATMKMYKDIASEHPDYKKDYVMTRFDQCAERARELRELINTGKIAVPDPDAAASGEGKGYVAKPAAVKLEDASTTSPTFTHGIPTLMLEQDALDVLSGTPVKTAASIAAADKKDEPAVSGVEAAPQSPEDGYVEDEVFADRKQSMTDGNDFVRSVAVEQLIRTGDAPDAVIILEDIIEEEDGSAATTTRILFVRSLIECRNFSRAQTELKTIFRKDPTNPSARTMSAAIALQKGDFAEAVFQMDRLMLDHPGYSDAYVNMAYVYLMMDPGANRDMAIMYYKTALDFGAKRDPRLESDLNIEVVN